MAGWTATTISDVDAVAWPGGLTWHPVRRALGLHAFGAGGWSAADAGETVIEPHREDTDGRAHEELYVVLRGSARFELDGEVVIAAAGTLVAVTDPAVHRSAVALEPGTQVLALGGPPEFRPAGAEWLMQARPLIRSDPAQARSILEDGRRELGGRGASPAIAFGFALLHAAAGDRLAAAYELRDALDAEPALRAEAAREPVLAPLVGEVGEVG